MSAITSLINPLSSPGNPVILQFSTNESSSLVYQDILLTQTPEIPIEPNSKIASGPSIAANSNIAAVVFQNAVQVYGIVTTSVGGVDTNYMCLLSPVVNPMADIVTASGALASTAGTDATGNVGTFLYFLAPQASGLIPQLVEIQLANDGLQNVLPAPFPAPGSSLAAFYNPITFKRWAIFQDSSNNIWFSIIDNISHMQMQSSVITGAREGTPLAACFNATTGNFYVYFQDENMDLRRGTGSPNSFDVSDVVPLGIPLDSQTTISATPDPTGKINHVFFVVDGGSGRVIHHMLDNVN